MVLAGLDARHWKRIETACNAQLLTGTADALRLAH